MAELTEETLSYLEAEGKKDAAALTGSLLLALVAAARERDALRARLARIEAAAREVGEAYRGPFIYIDAASKRPSHAVAALEAALEQQD